MAKGFCKASGLQSKQVEERFKEAWQAGLQNTRHRKQQLSLRWWPEGVSRCNHYLNDALARISIEKANSGFHMCSCAGCTLWLPMNEALTHQCSAGRRAAMARSLPWTTVLLSLLAVFATSDARRLLVNTGGTGNCPLQCMGQGGFSRAAPVLVQ